jgi:hypothetical protein
VKSTVNPNVPAEAEPRAWLPVFRDELPGAIQVWRLVAVATLIARTIEEGSPSRALAVT